MDDQQTKTFEYLNLRATETLEKIGKKRFRRKKLFSGDSLVCEIFIDENSLFRRRLDYSKILNDLCDRFEYRSNETNENTLKYSKQFSDAIDLLDKLEQLGLKLQYPAEATDLGQAIREYQIEIFKKGSECLKILFPEAAERLREKEQKTNL